MNNITLNASNEMDLKIAECFIGCESTFPYDAKGILQGVHDGRFALIEWEHDYNLWMPKEITLDLDTCQPCIYTAMKHGLRVEVEFADGYTTEMDFSNREHCASIFECIHQIKSIKLLDMKVGEE
tara:strand:- start:2238 stop:2612 length:375 start_codon:yes stop_codon:yes gene_type:complete